MARVIEITIDESTAEMTVDLHGFHGIGCSALIDGLKSGETIERKTKPEYKATKVAQTLQVSRR
jgi:hypothetical protein